LVKIISKPSAILYTAFKIIRNCNKSAADCAIAFKFGTVSSCHRRYIANVQGQRSEIKVTGSQVKVTAYRLYL